MKQATKNPTSLGFISNARLFKFQLKLIKMGISLLFCRPIADNFVILSFELHVKIL